MAETASVEKRAGDDGPEHGRLQPQDAAAGGTADTSCWEEQAALRASGWEQAGEEETAPEDAERSYEPDGDAPSQRDIDAALGRRLRDAERKAYRRFMEEHAHRLYMGDMAMNILGRNARQQEQGAQPAHQPTYAQPQQGLPYPQPAQQYAQTPPEQPYPQPPQQYTQAPLPDPAALVRAAQREMEAIGDPDFTLEAVMADDRARFMLAQGRDIYEIYGRFQQSLKQGRQARRPRVEARANSGMDSVEYDFRNAPREVIDRIDAQLKRGQYVSL